MNFENSHFNYSLECRPDFAFMSVELPANETLKVEASAMATMDTNVGLKTKLSGGFSRMLTGESLFINELTAEGGPAEVGVAPGSPGDMAHVLLEGGDDTIYLQNSAFVASGMNVEVDTKWQGFLKGLLSGENFFFIRCSGEGDLWFNTYGALLEIDVSGGYTVDTGHVVAFTHGLDYNVTRLGGYKSLFLSGEGLVCQFSGNGKVWIQTRDVPALSWWVRPFRPVESSNN